MRTVLFLENREKTALWAQVARRLRAQHHRVVWLVQNPAFVPRAEGCADELRCMPWPAIGARVDEAAALQRHPVLVRERGRLHFDAGCAHYDHYAAEIARALDDWRPDLVVGECTLFHELLAIEACRARGIAFVHPCANRYPAGRFALFQGDTQLPAAGSGERWPADQLADLAERIASNRELPFYMRRPGTAERAWRRVQWAATRGRVWWARLQGERYNTPSLALKWRLSRGVKGLLLRWQALARRPSDPSTTLLYPLQLQPEANIDVWGRPYSDQLALVQRLLAALPATHTLALKANPKSKYELSDALLALAAREPRLCLLPLDLPMPEAHRMSLGAVTVSGTVGLEAVFGKGRCLSLRHPVIEQLFPHCHAESPEQAVERLLADPAAGLGRPGDGPRLLAELIAHSFPGLVSDPLSHPACLEEDNIDRVAQGLLAWLRTHEPAPSPDGPTP
ncbi:hypothetical protein [Ideonella alba]|uniref:Capsule biosynthesis protein n=1 Tax=Ideonella alba TaxID=2824118 RepID=A0A940Y6J3_9BURK|nr:hypothetical protein [Ideonella alba]MBQ0929631.1 hypothetical protein [Ideonella alba]